MAEPLITFTDHGLYVPRADVFIDPWRKVPRALITHGHSDHARPGHQHYLATASATPVLRHRLGAGIKVDTVQFGERRTIHGVTFSFHPAGHILGSAQIRVAYRGEVWVVSGDYKVVNDGLAEAFEPVPCHTFITESTFGLPVYRWPDAQVVREEILRWWRQCREEEQVPVLAAYSLGKAQRLLRLLEGGPGPLFTHGSVAEVNEVFSNQGIDLPPTTRLQPDLKRSDLLGGLVIAPPGALGAAWMRKWGSVSTAMASGWMAVRGPRRRRAMDRGFVLSDHADWPGLLKAIQDTGAEQVFVTHGYSEDLARYLRETGLQARVVRTEYSGDEEPEPTQESAS